MARQLGDTSIVCLVWSTGKQLKVETRDLCRVRVEITAAPAMPGRLSLQPGNQFAFIRESILLGTFPRDAFFRSSFCSKHLVSFT